MVDINGLTNLFEKLIPKIIEPLEQIAGNTDRIVNHLTSSKQTAANRGNIEAISLSSGGTVNTQNTIESIDNFLATVTLRTINNTGSPMVDLINNPSKVFSEALLDMPIGEILNKKIREIPIRIVNRDIYLGETGLRQLLCKIAECYCNEQKKVDTKS